MWHFCRIYIYGYQTSKNVKLIKIFSYFWNLLSVPSNNAIFWKGWWHCAVTRLRREADMLSLRCMIRVLKKESKNNSTCWWCLLFARALPIQVLHKPYKENLLFYIHWNGDNVCRIYWATKKEKDGEYCTSIYCKRLSPSMMIVVSNFCSMGSACACNIEFTSEDDCNTRTLD